ncbi:hypothetical protein KFL_004750060 [Klebsormidium nitens]|uniref:Zinc finger PHD-type domain-containing protein n=1 Tax=Klebsormidium nitens TaxID=105231 RepID=A0A1Y1IK04_KLENI|nr:hypothetical protein KFL_004750060 [Klebsormidium nitens]|eukprot:GAQ88977.1 hypothetical protein KFL_004750060 [Klebsormidium nitens]
MAAAPADIGRGTLYVFVEAGRGEEPLCFSNLCSPQGTISSLREAIERQSRDAGVLKSKECIRHLKLVFQNHPEVLLSNDDPLDIVFTILNEHSGKDWRQTFASGVWPRITAVVKKKKKRTQAANVSGAEHAEEGVATPAREEGETSRKRRAEGSADQEGDPQKTQKRGAGDTARSRRPSVPSAAADQAGPSGSAPGTSLDEMPTARLGSNPSSEERGAATVQQIKSERGSKERGATSGKEAESEGVSQRGREARSARKETTTGKVQKHGGSEASEATMRRGDQIGGVDRRPGQVMGDEGRTAFGRDEQRRGADEIVERGRGSRSGTGREREQIGGAETRGQKEVQRMKAEESALIGRRGLPAKGAVGKEPAFRKEGPATGGARQPGPPGDNIEGAPTVRKSKRRALTNYQMSDSEDEAGPSLAERASGVRVNAVLGKAGGPRAVGRSSGCSLEGVSGGSNGRAASGELSRGNRSKRNPLSGKGERVGATVEAGSKESAGGSCTARGSKKPADARQAKRCNACEDADNPELMLVCARDGCRTAQHIYCHSEDLEEVPKGDWFCSVGCETKAGERRGGPWEVVGRPVCSVPGCLKNAYYGYREAGLIVRERCGEHKRLGMQQAGGNVCEILGCHTQAHFANREAVRRWRCAKHREVGMEATFTCDVSGCPITPTWRSIESKGRRCTAHKLPGMTPNDCCKTNGCSRRATFYYSGEARSACQHHARPGMMSKNTKRVLLPRDCL